MTAPTRGAVSISHANPEDAEISFWLRAGMTGAGYGVWADQTVRRPRLATSAGGRIPQRYAHDQCGDRKMHLYQPHDTAVDGERCWRRGEGGACETVPTSDPPSLEPGGFGVSCGSVATAHGLSHNDPFKAARRNIPNEIAEFSE